VAVYPNPTHGKLIIKSKVNASYAVTNLFGAALYKGNLMVGTNTIDLVTLAKGVYIVQVREGLNTYNVKILRQ
jgi:myo-inositol-hexaphosphate 3-phosphohydrolase